ncbi:OmpP1/FadL family transporter [Flavobacterium subsaxonicum]|uniref:Transporter n=1 Tax=Flavobacterium subsaxonicum WB 4.1-42 = DSM 21790 TaxID=1121898 RepID=A0A0A2MHV0_9FLAO|nr:outer membrane protein transport protein [Flavobacterium subsaxonicum]KGO91043.1 transporter [Flavobacterium subsaxonicum WB 4.1-42 = DSM 21790]
MRKLLSLTMMALAASSAFAGGYRVSLQGQKQLAMGHTGVAVVNSAEVLFFNPAGAAYLKDRFNFSAGANGLFAKTKFQNETYNWTNSTDNFGTPFEVYASYRATDWLTVGLAVYSPYGSAVEWDQDWQGSHLVNNIDLQAIYIQPTVAIKVNDRFSVGGGPIFVTGSVNFNRNLTRSLTDEQGNRSDVTVDAKGVTAWGWDAGFMFNPIDGVRLGVNYRSEITMEARDGDATFHDLPAFAQGTYQNTQFDADLPLPAELTAGISVEITDKWLVAFDYNMAFWHVYDALTISFANGTPTSVNPRNYKDAGTYRFGTQFKPNEKFAFRAGWYFDESPVQDGYFAPETPRNDSMGFTGGLTYQINPKLGIDFSFLYLHFDETNNSYNYYSEDGSLVSFGGTYKNTVFSPGLGLTYSF